MSEPKLAPPTEWDKKLIDCLRPLAKAGWVHHTVFFANTFPLGFHYAWALNLEKKSVKDHLLSSAWEQPPAPVKAKNTKAFFWKTQNPKKGEENGFIPVTIFQPKFVFVQKTLATSRIFDEFKIQNNEELPLLDFLKKAKLHYDTVEIYAELAVLGDYLKKKISSVISGPRIYDAGAGEGWPLIEPFVKRGHSTLRLFIYGGPLSTYLKRKNNHYIKTIIDSDVSNGAEKQLATGIQMIGSSDVTFKRAIQKYHRELYSAALQMREGKEESDLKCPPFYSVCHAYNDTAWLMQHRSSFKEPFEYAECIKEHHKKVDT